MHTGVRHVRELWQMGTQLFHGQQMRGVDCAAHMARFLWWQVVEAAAGVGLECGLLPMTQCLRYNTVP